MERTVYTLGHSSHSEEHFLALLRTQQTDVLVDTRSSPHSKFASQFSQGPFKLTLRQAGMHYPFPGASVGGRPAARSFYEDAGHVLYGKLCQSAEFPGGIARIERGAETHRIALLCGEEDPAHCHRRLLIGRVLMERGATLLHVRGTGKVETDAEISAASGKASVDPQPALFGEIDEAKWKSTASVSRKRVPENSGVLERTHWKLIAGVVQFPTL